MAGRLFRCAASLLADAHVARALSAASNLTQMQAVVQRHGPQHPHLQRLADAVLVHVDTPQVRPSVVFAFNQLLLQHDTPWAKASACQVCNRVFPILPSFHCKDLLL